MLKNFFINAFVSLGVTTAVLLAAGRFLGERLFGHWLDGRLETQKREHAVELEKLRGAQNKELEELRNEQNREIEKLRGDIGHLQDRGRRANEHEFAALRAICDKLEDLFAATYRCVALFQRVFDWGRMTDEALGRFSEANNFTPGERATLHNARDKQAVFENITTYRSVAQAQSAYDDFRAVLDRQSIFIPKPLEDQLRAAGALCPGAFTVRNAEAQGRPPPGMTDDLVFLQQHAQVLSEVRDAVRERLQYEDRKIDDDASAAAGPHSGSA